MASRLEDSKRQKAQYSCQKYWNCIHTGNQLIFSCSFNSFSPQLFVQEVHRIVKPRLLDRKISEEMVERLFTSKPKMCIDNLGFFVIFLHHLFSSLLYQTQCKLDDTSREDTGATLRESSL